MEYIGDVKLNFENSNGRIKFKKVIVDGKEGYIPYVGDFDEFVQKKQLAFEEKRSLQLEKTKQKRIDTRYDRIYDYEAKQQLRFKARHDNINKETSVSYKTIGKEEARKNLWKKLISYMAYKKYSSFIFKNKNLL